MAKKLITGFIIVICILFVSFGLYIYPHYTVPILMYHSLDEARIGTYAAVAPQTFYKQMKVIKDRGFRVIHFDEYCRLLKAKEPIPRNLVVITFDDGHKDNVKAAEILKEFGFPATIFLIADNIGKQGSLSKEDIDTILEKTKIRIDSHTLTHAYLPDVDNQKLGQEIESSKRKLERLFPYQIKTISYPIGGFDERVLKKVKEAGYLCACTTNRGFSDQLDIFALRRIKITNRDLGIRLWAKLSGFYTRFKKPKNPY